MPARMDIGESLARARGQLEARGRDEAHLKAELIAAHVLGLPRLRLAEYRAGFFPGPDEARFLALVARVAEGEPLQYVLGETWFRGRRFQCDRRALIPRPETEELVDRVLGIKSLWRRPAPAVADVGTGTGCIAISLVLERPQGRYAGVDASAEALDLARTNAGLLGAGGRIDWMKSDLLAAFAPESLDAVVSNPPYVSTHEMAELAPEILNHEPHLALHGGVDGLNVIRRLGAESFQKLRSGGTVVLEIGEKQSAAVREVLATAGFLDVTVMRDMAGQERFVMAGRP